MSYDYITGEKFAALADNKIIYYCHTHELSTFLQNPPTYPFVLITHNSDHSVHIGYKIPRNLIHWFAQNVNRDSSKIESIPIGLENEKWFKGLKKKQTMTGLLTKSKQERNLVYMNHSISTNPAKRYPPYYVLEGKEWVTAERGQNGQDFNRYINNVYNHRFVVCPEGNGIDTVRLWETLYMKSIPIEKRNINNQFYTDLPICFVNDWTEVTEDFLNKEYDRISNTTWNLDKLNFSYWKHKILSYAE